MEEEEQQGHGHVGVTAESTTTILARESRHEAGTMSTLTERGQTSDKVNRLSPRLDVFFSEDLPSSRLATPPLDRQGVMLSSLVQGGRF